MGEHFIHKICLSATDTLIPTCPPILDFEGNVDRFACYHFWSMRFWILLVMVAPLPILYNLHYQALIPTGVTRGPSGIFCRIGDQDTGSDDACYVKVPWFTVEEKIET